MDNQDFITKMLMARENMVREFDADAAAERYLEHHDSPWCQCEPEAFGLESGNRAYRHKRDS